MILNISAYRFVPIADPRTLREQLLALCTGLRLKGTILLAEEGINLFVAGVADDVRGFLVELRRDEHFASIDAKESWSAAVPFRRMLVKVKREIIRMNHPAIRPYDGRAPAVDAATLARWLDAGRDDEGRPVVLLDTRNDFEVGHGTFESAMHWSLRRFSDFPAAFDAHVDALRDATIVSFCTGGIRCEKAALYMRERGLDRVLQLDGGILRYLEQVPGAPHWQGRCFVFDEREALDADLQPKTVRADHDTLPGDAPAASPGTAGHGHPDGYACATGSAG